MEWTDETIERLQCLWAEGHSTAEIGRRLLVSKNAVVGKAHRLNLAPRPSPIRRADASGSAPSPPRPARCLEGPTLPPLSGVAADAGPLPGRHRPSQPQTALRSVATLRPPARIVACCWPIGDPGTPSFRFCDAAASSGKPYCSVHAQVAYVKVRDRSEDAA